MGRGGWTCGRLGRGRKLSSLRQRLHVAIDPGKNPSKTKLAVGKRAHDEPVGFESADIKIEAVSGEKSICRGKCDTFIAVNEGGVVGEGLHERGSFLRKAVVVAILRTKNCGLKSCSIPKPVRSAEFIDQFTVHLLYLRNREINILGH